MYAFLLAIIYLCFISLGLPDSLLGAAWPSMYIDLSTSLSYAGLISVTISCCTITSSLLSDFLTKKLTPRVVVVISIALSALGLFGFSISSEFYMLLLWAIPYGFGAGSIDAALNGYVALHFKSQHMSWLHCMWGVGCTISPYIMSYAISSQFGWRVGYSIVSIIQGIICLIVLISLPFWNKIAKSDEEKATYKPLTPKEIFSVPGAITCFIAFFSYCALESTTFLWASSYMVLTDGFSEEKAAMLASMFFIGITVGRAINGFLSMKFNDKTLIRAGICLLAIGILLFALPFSPWFSIIGFVITGFGCAPIYPCIIHSTPNLFGKDKSQAMIGFQMAFAYVGSALMPPLFGFLTRLVGIQFLPLYVGLLLISLFIFSELTNKKTSLKNRRTI